jgi:hypothetical protein
MNATARLSCIAALFLVACGDDPAPGADAREVTLGCDAEAQDCADGLKCNPTGSALPPWDGTTCVDDNAASGSSAGSFCFNGPDATDTCDPDTMCLQLGTGEGICTPYCTDTPDDTCGADQVCVLYDDAVGLKLCALQCDLADDQCPLTFNCIETLAGPACVPFAIEDTIPRG